MSAFSARPSLLVSLLFTVACGAGGGTTPTTPTPPGPRTLSLTVSNGPTQVVSGQALGAALQITVRDQTGAVATDFSGEITLGSTSADLRLAGTLSTRPVNGVASFTDAVLLAPGGSHTLDITAPGATSTQQRVTLVQPTLRVETQRISAGTAHTCALPVGRSVRCWGRNGAGELGDGTLTERTLPVALAADPGLLAVEAGSNHTCGLTASGEAWCWGFNSEGAVGDSTPDRVTAPVRVRTDLRFRSLSLGTNFTCGLIADGTAWCWGSNRSGELGVAGRALTAASFTPVRVDGTLRFAQLAAGLLSVCGITEGSGLAYCWGANGNGVNVGFLGNNDPSSNLQRSPGPVATSAIGVNSFSAIGGTGRGACVLRRAEGTAYCWGTGSVGQNGDGTTVTRLSPVQVSPVFRFTELSKGNSSHVCAGTDPVGAACWGVGGNGQLGNAQGGFFTTPQRVLELDVGIREIATGSLHTCALTADDRVACWGRNNEGQLGIGTQADVSRPVFISP